MATCAGGRPTGRVGYRAFPVLQSAAPQGCWTVGVLRVMPKPLNLWWGFAQLWRKHSYWKYCVILCSMLAVYHLIWAYLYLQGQQHCSDPTSSSVVSLEMLSYTTQWRRRGWEKRKTWNCFSLLPIILETQRLKWLLELNNYISSSKSSMFSLTTKRNDVY